MDFEKLWRKSGSTLGRLSRSGVKEVGAERWDSMSTHAIPYWGKIFPSSKSWKNLFRHSILGQNFSISEKLKNLWWHHILGQFFVFGKNYKTQHYGLREGVSPKICWNGPRGGVSSNICWIGPREGVRPDDDRNGPLGCIRPNPLRFRDCS